jgi:Regulator of microtubule dynamics protein 1-3
MQLNKKLLLSFLSILLIASFAVAEHAVRLDPVVADSIAKSSNEGFVAVDALNRAWLDSEALGRLSTMSTIDAEYLWRMARSRVNVGENLSKDESEEFYAPALDEAKRAVELDDKNADAHLMVAVASGRMALLRGAFKAAGLVKQGYRHAHHATALRDSIPVAYYILGKTHKKLMEKSGLARRIAGLRFAKEDSISYYFDKALEISEGNMVQCCVEYADYLIKEEVDVERGRELLQQAIDLPLRDEQDVAAKEWAAEMLAE